MYSSKKLRKTLLPKAPGLKLEDVAIDAETVSLPVAAICPSIYCPMRGHTTARWTRMLRGAFCYGDRTETAKLRGKALRSWSTRATASCSVRPAHVPLGRWLHSTRDAAALVLHDALPIYREVCGNLHP